MELLVARGGYDWRDLVDQDRWRTLLGHAPRAHDATEEESSTTDDDIFTYNSMYDVVKESKRSRFEVCAYESERRGSIR